MTDVIEREIKVKLDVDPQKFIDRLVKEGYEYLGREVQEDIYLNGEAKDFKMTDEALRIRTVGDKIELTYKGPRMGSESKSREEITVVLDSRESMVKILEKLGYRPVYKIKKIRYTFKKENFTICVDNVEGLGNFLEVEGINVEERELMDFFNKIKILFNLKEEVITKSYLELMVNALDHSNSN